MPVYFVQSGGESGPVKIGFTQTIGGVRRRLLELQTGNPAPLEVIRVIKDGELNHEKALHEFFSDLRLSREWFTFDPLMMTLLSNDEEFAFFSRPLIKGGVGRPVKLNPRQRRMMQRRMIAERYAKGATMKALAEEFGVSEPTIWRALRTGAP